MLSKAIISTLMSDRDRVVIMERLLKRRLVDTYIRNRCMHHLTSITLDVDLMDVHAIVAGRDRLRNSFEVGRHPSFSPL